MSNRKLMLSSVAVKTGVAGIKWVTDLRRARSTGALARAGLNATRLARFGGWFYTAAELAVVLYVADELDTRITAALDLRDARGTVADAARTLVAATCRLCLSILIALFQTPLA